MRILWLSNSPLSMSGYGKQTALFTSRLRDMGHEVAISANHGIRETNAVWNGIPLFDGHNPNSTLATFAKHWEADWVIGLYDAWTYEPEKWPDVKMAAWVPIDHSPPPFHVAAVLANERIRPIAMSRFGERWLKTADLDPLYAPHGVDTKVFRPLEGGREEGRKALGIPQDAFVVGMVGANRGWSIQACRKAFPQMFDAFSHFARRHDDAFLYCHTHMAPAAPGMDLIFLAKTLQIPDSRMAFPNDEAWHLNLMDDHFLAGVMNTFDVLCHSSMSEGFGVPIIEAQACGVPVIVCDNTSMPELSQTQWLVGGDRWWNGDQKSWAMMPSVSSIVEQLEVSYEARGDQKVKDAAVQFAQTYDADRVAEKYWAPVLEALERPKEVPPLVKRQGPKVRA